VRRRTFLAGGAGTVAVLSATEACSSPEPAAPSSAAPAPGATEGLPEQVAKLRSQYLAQFDEEYVDKVIVPHFLNRVLDGERPVLPMIDVGLTKENALPYDLWGAAQQDLETRT
jgi:hypothetical protein